MRAYFSSFNQSDHCFLASSLPLSSSLLKDTAVKRLSVTRANFPREFVQEKNSRNNKIYEKQVVGVIENFKRKTNYAKGKFKTSRTQSLLNYGYSVDLPFREELYQKSYMCLKHRVTLWIYFQLVVL